MPELPDVETVARMLRQQAVGGRILRVRVLNPSTIRSPSPSRFVHRLRGRKIDRVLRRGKYLLIDLEGALTLIVHLRMTGSFAVARGTDPIPLHTRVIFSFEDHELRFVDQRRFAHMDLLPRLKVPTFPALRRLGVEPLDDSFTLARFRSLLEGRRGTVKRLLLRQDLIAGIGNIYADEILFQARLRPMRPCASLSPAELGGLHRKIRSVLQLATARLSRYGKPVGALLGVRKTGGACPRCGRQLRSAKVAGRTSFYCSACQR